MNQADGAAIAVPVGLAPRGVVADPVAEERFAATLAAARAGDERAWSVLYSGIAGKLRAYLVALGAAEPDDLLGEVFVQVARNLPRFRGTEANFRSWLFIIAHNRVLDARRAARRRPVPVALDEVATDLPSMVGPSAEHETLDRLAASRVAAHMEGLTADQQAVLLLRYLGDLTLEEVANATGRPLGAVKQLHRRGLRAIRRRLDEAVAP